MKTINKVCELVVVPKKGESLKSDCGCEEGDNHPYPHCGLAYHNHNIYLNGNKVYLQLVCDTPIDGHWCINPKGEIEIFGPDFADVYTPEEIKRCKGIVATTDFLKYLDHSSNSHNPELKAVPFMYPSFLQKYAESGGIDSVNVKYSEDTEELVLSLDNTVTITEIKTSWTREEVLEFGEKCFDYGVKAESGQIEFEDHGKEKIIMKRILEKEDLEL